MRPLFVEGGARTGAEFTLDLVIGDHVTPLPSLGIEVHPVGKGPRGQEVAFDEGKQAFDMRLAVGVPHGMRDEAQAEVLPEGLHFRGDGRIRTAAGGDQDAGIVDGTARAAAR